MRLYAVADFRDRSYASVPEVFFGLDETSWERIVIASDLSSVTIGTAEVTANHPLCREHYRLTFRLDAFAAARPGQFVHLCPPIDEPTGYQTYADDARAVQAGRACRAAEPMLRRAFSIAGLERSTDHISLDVIYRVVGKATRWMESLRTGDALSVLGPLGNAFPIPDDRSTAWLVAGGVGLPPMLWLADALHRAGKRSIGFLGAQSADLLALTFDPSQPPSNDARRAALCCREFARSQTRVVVSTDDGTLGFHGHVGQALLAYHEARPIAAAELVVYTCGPERMMRFVADYCRRCGFECHVCMERAMACGTGLCQSCVVPVRDESDIDGWCYRLCCKDGPVFAGTDILWEPVGAN